jgi:hypothetical protein
MATDSMKYKNYFDFTILVLAFICIILIFVFSSCLHLDLDTEDSVILGKSKTIYIDTSNKKKLVNIVFKNNDMIFLYYNDSLKQYELHENKRYIKNITIIKHGNK